MKKLVSRLCISDTYTVLQSDYQLGLYHTHLNSSELLSSEIYNYTIYELDVMLSVEAKINYLHSTTSSSLHLSTC